MIPQKSWRILPRLSDDSRLYEILRKSRKILLKSSSNPPQILLDPPQILLNPPQILENDSVEHTRTPFLQVKDAVLKKACLKADSSKSRLFHSFRSNDSEEKGAKLQAFPLTLSFPTWFSTGNMGVAWASLFCFFETKRTWYVMGQSFLCVKVPVNIVWDLLSILFRTLWLSEYKLFPVWRVTNKTGGAVPLLSKC